MQIDRAEVTPVVLKLYRPFKMAGLSPIEEISAIFVRLVTRHGASAWGCAVAHPSLNGEDPAHALKACQDCADRAPDLHPTNLEHSLSELAIIAHDSPAALCAFDLAFHDLLGLAASMPLYRLLGGYRNRIQTSITIPLSSLGESIELAQNHARHGFRILKIKGGLDPELDVQRVQAIRRILPDHILRLDADGGYNVRQALDVVRALEGIIEIIEQPTPANDLTALLQVTQNCPIQVVADQSVCGPESALEVASRRCAHGMTIKLAACGGLRTARQVDAIGRAAHMATMVSCLEEPAMLIGAGLSFALSSSNVRYGDLDGHLDLSNDPSQPGFTLQDGWLIANEVPGLGCNVNLN